MNAKKRMMTTIHEIYEEHKRCAVVLSLLSQSRRSSGVSFLPQFRHEGEFIGERR
ncbi:MAG: hypothetical protein SFZ02_03920 [bacterium]|nr:hypothetical protein [bacterium]